ncbi:EAL domain-containing protein [Candidatus Marinarcus aquaticus]|uniref:Diguanylate cyclase n=1 Tax=Candidatus Marinarcus aquaticus TaxID=2044504 RepID=A0A4Q0XRX5_9BACT|nr:EAL domain-containing protein [Candidatus Marinarcus aquaticus]RXJ60012.1 diguanylate cyclase [Candidatus Marinarcus aquaticus]
MVHLTLALVEDETFLREKLEKILKREVEVVYAFSSAKETLRKIPEIMPDIILTDIKMAEMSGLEMVEEIRKLNLPIKVIVASAFSEPAYFQKAIKLKVENFLVKPIDIDELLYQLKEIEKNLTIEKAYHAKNKLLNEYKEVVDKSNHITKTDIKGTITYANDRFCKLCGYTQEELIGSPHNIVRHEDMPASFFKRMWTTILNKQTWHGTIKSKTKYGDAFYIETTIAPILDENNNIEEFISIKNNVTELVNNKRDLQKEIVTDRLTGIPNRIKLSQDLKEFQSASIILLDIEKFHETNNLFGLDFGDKILIFIAQKLKYLSLQRECSCYRISADEFILLSHNQSSEKLIETINQLEQDIKLMPFEENNISFDIDITYGIVTNTQDINNNMLIGMAESALSDARKEHKLYSLYSQDKNQQKAYEYNFEWTKKIKDALNEDRIDIYFQPLVSTITQETVKFECLVRYIERDGSVISPFYFLEVAKRSRLYNDITKVVIQKACEVFSQRKEKFSINLSIEDIVDEQTIDFLIKEVQQHHLFNRIIIEILESEGIDNYNKVIDIVEKLKGHGIEIAIDDFGTGYSNFAHLISLDIDILKIDGSLIKDIDQNISSRSIVKSILSFTKELNIKTVAEFVNSQEVFDVIQELGVDLAQGYYFSEPISKEKLEELS